MITDLHIRASARRIVAAHGAAAWPHAVAETEAQAAAGDWRQVAIWRRIGGAIRELQRDPVPGAVALAGLDSRRSGRAAAP